jgi:hypothetical protein
MTVYSKVSYDEQDDGQIFKAKRKQQYIIFPVLIELGMKTKKEEDEDEVQF